MRHLLYTKRVLNDVMGKAVAVLFRNELHNDFVWALGYIPFGGADFGKIQAVAEVIADGDGGAFHDAWVTAGGRLKTEADEHFGEKG